MDSNQFSQGAGSACPASVKHSVNRVVVASNYQLSRRSHVNRLAIATVERDIPRRRLADWIAEIIARYDGEIVWATGAPFVFDDEAIDQAFGIEEDPSQRWVGDFYKFAVKPPKQVAQARIIERLRYIDLAFRIAYPERARLIAE
jgi:hypothetical protein